MERSSLLDDLWQSAVPQRRSATTIHLAGLAGTGMKALAEFLADAGFTIQGTDCRFRIAASRSSGSAEIRELPAEDSQALQPGVELLVYSTAVPESDPTRRRADELGIPQVSYPEMLAQLTRQRRAVCVAGTHGKSTTTSILVDMMSNAGLNPSWLIGAERIVDRRNGRFDSGEHLILESCEYRRHFLKFSPTAAIIQSVEWDHIDCFSSESDTREAFREFMSLVPNDGVLVVNDSIPDLHALTSSVRPRIRSFGLSDHSDWKIETVGTTHCLVGPKGTRIPLALPMAGLHNAMNAAAAAVMAHELGVKTDIIAGTLRDFQGICRRLERYPDWHGRIRFDDYAHHPTAVHAVLESLREQYPSSGIIAVFEAHQASRLRAFRDRFAEALSLADQVLLAPVFGARESDAEEHDRLLGELAVLIERNGIPVHRPGSLDQIRTTLQTDSQIGDVLITLGAGEVNQVQHEFI